jgi:hypothetical protein
MRYILCVMMGTVFAGGITTVAAQASDSEALAKQATRCALHADLASSTEKDQEAKAKWLRQKDALVIFSLSVSTSEQAQIWIDEFADEIVNAKTPKQYAEVVRSSTAACQAFLSAHGSDVTAAYNKAHGQGG